MYKVEILIDIYGLWQIVDKWHNKNKQKWEKKRILRLK